MAQLGVGIIGCGWVAEEHIKAFEHDQRSRVAALVSRRLESAELYRDRYNLDCAAGTDFEKMLERDDVDIVAVTTPNNVHTDYVVAAAQAGKHVLIEKPMALTMADVYAQQKAIADNDVKSLCSFVLHWNPLLMTIDNLVQDGTFGDIFMVEVDYLHRIWVSTAEKWYADFEQSGTALLTAGCHAIDALRWFMPDAEVEEVQAYQTKTSNPVEYPATISVNVRFDNGHIGRSTTSFDARMPYRFNIGVYGTEASMRNNQIFAPAKFPGQNADEFIEIPCVLPDSGDVTEHPFRGEASHLIDCILGDTRPFPDADDAAKTHAVCIAADLSANEGRPVKISEVE